MCSVLLSSGFRSFHERNRRTVILSWFALSKNIYYLYDFTEKNALTKCTWDQLISLKDFNDFVKYFSNHLISNQFPQKKNPISRNFFKFIWHNYGNHRHTTSNFCCWYFYETCDFLQKSFPFRTSMISVNMSFFATWHWTNISRALFRIQNNIRIQCEVFIFLPIISHF